MCSRRSYLTPLAELLQLQQGLILFEAFFEGQAMPHKSQTPPLIVIRIDLSLRQEERGMSMYIKRSDRGRRQAINDLDHFACGGVERRAYGAERRAYQRTIDISMKTQGRRALFQLFR